MTRHARPPAGQSSASRPRPNAGWIAFQASAMTLDSGPGLDIARRIGKECGLPMRTGAGSRAPKQYSSPACEKARQEPGKAISKIGACNVREDGDRRIQPEFSQRSAHQPVCEVGLAVTYFFGIFRVFPVHLLGNEMIGF